MIRCHNRFAVLTVMHPILITLLLLAAAIGCPVAASVTHCMLQTREVLADSPRGSTASRVNADRAGDSEHRLDRRAAARIALRAQPAEGAIQRITLLDFAANPPPMGA